MRGHNLCFPREIIKIIFELSPVPLLIWSSEILLVSRTGFHVRASFAYVLLLISGAAKLIILLEWNIEQ